MVSRKRSLIIRSLTLTFLIVNLIACIALINVMRNQPRLIKPSSADQFSLFDDGFDLV